MRANAEGSSLRPFLRAGMAICAVIMAHHVAARATRDTLFLTNFPVRMLPMVVAVASLVSVAAAIFATQRMTKDGPVRFLRVSFALSAVLTLVEWFLVGNDSGLAAILVYVHVVTVGPVLVGGFWSLINERLAPRSAKRSVGTIAGLGTLGGLAGGVIAERLTTWAGVGAAFPALALAHAWCAWSIGGGVACAPPAPAIDARGCAPSSSHSLSLPEAARRILETPYLLNLALLVFGTTLCSGLLDYVFKAQASDVAGGSAVMMRIFSSYYAGVAVLTFILQTALAGRMLERVGLAPTIGTLPAAIAGGSAFAAVLMSPWSVGAVRAVESVLEGSLYRAGREVLYTPIPPLEKRGTRMLIETVFDRAGEITSAGLIALVLAASPLSALRQILWITVPCALVMLYVVSRVQRGYVSSLEAGLRARHVHFDASFASDLTTLKTLRDALGTGIASSAPGRARPLPPQTPTSFAAAAAADAARHEARARGSVSLRSQAPDELVALLIDSHTDFDTRRRIPGELARTPSTTAVAGLLHGLEDARFEVRYRCGRALARMLETDRSLSVDEETVLTAVRREAALGRRIWESQRLLDQLDEPVDDAFVDQFVRERSGRSLEHVFTLLSLVLPREPLRIAFRGLHADDPLLRGTALEYLDTVLPADVHAVLWPHLEPRAPRRRGAPEPARPARDRAQVLDDLMRSNHSIELHLDELRRREGR